MLNIYEDVPMKLQITVCKENKVISFLQNNNKTRNVGGNRWGTNVQSIMPQQKGGCT